MRNSRSLYILAAVVSLSWAGYLLPAEAQNDVEARARAALRTATAQLRDLQDQNAQLMAKQAEAERDRMALAQKVAAGEREIAALRAQLQAGQTAAERVTAQVQAEKDNLAKADTDYKENLSKWQSAYNEAAETARTRDADAKRFDAALAKVREEQRLCEGMNAELYKIGQEVLDLYDSQSFIAKLRANEPITQLKRVEYQALIQKFEDRLRASQVTRQAAK
jgi:chromosome segregation ATPase